MFKIERSADGESVVFTISGRIQAEELIELQNLVADEAADHRLILDLMEVKLVDRDVVKFLANCEAKGIKLAKCPAYIREWIEREGNRDGMA